MLKLQEGKMSAYLDIIILLLVVVMVFAKLKSLLGTRPENETEISRESAAKIFDILMQEHNRKHGAQPTPAELRTDDENLSESEKALQKIWWKQKKFIPLQPQNGKVLYGQLPSNPPGLDRSKGSWL